MHRASSEVGTVDHVEESTSVPLIYKTWNFQHAHYQYYACCRHGKHLCCWNKILSVESTVLSSHFELWTSDDLGLSQNKLTKLSVIDQTPPFPHDLQTPLFGIIITVKQALSLSFVKAPSKSGFNTTFQGTKIEGSSTLLSTWICFFTHLLKRFTERERACMYVKYLASCLVFC